jgi:hypothetical protein
VLDSLDASTPFILSTVEGLSANRGAIGASRRDSDPVARAMEFIPGSSPDRLSAIRAFCGKMVE